MQTLLASRPHTRHLRCPDGRSRRGCPRRCHVRRKSDCAVQMQHDVRHSKGGMESIMTDHIASCHPAAVLVKLIQVDVTGASLTFNFPHSARAPRDRQTGRIVSETCPQAWIPADEACLTFMRSSPAPKVPARITVRWVPDRGQQAVVSSPEAPQQAPCPNSSSGPSIHLTRDVVDGPWGCGPPLQARALTRHCACLGNTGRCNSREPTAITFPDW